MWIIVNNSQNMIWVLYDTVPWFTTLNDKIENSLDADANDIIFTHIMPYFDIHYIDFVCEIRVHRILEWTMLSNLVEEDTAAPRHYWILVEWLRWESLWIHFSLVFSQHVIKHSRHHDTNQIKQCNKTNSKSLVVYDPNGLKWIRKQSYGIKSWLLCSV